MRPEIRQSKQHSTVDETAPTVLSVVASGNGITNGSGILDAGHLIHLAVTMSELVTVTTAGNLVPQLVLNDGGRANYDPVLSHDNTLTFDYVVSTGQNTHDLSIVGVQLHGATIKDAAGNSANMRS
jgi:hypothetical protein